MDHSAQKPTEVQTSGKATAAIILGILSLCFSVVTGIPAIIVGAIAVTEINNSQGRLGGMAQAIVGLVLGTFSLLGLCIIPALLLPAFTVARQAAREAAGEAQISVGEAVEVVQESLSNFDVSDQQMKQIGLGLHQYHNTYKSFPITGSNDPQYGVQYSWRVRVLPYIGEAERFDRYNQNHAWDHPDNLPLASSMPSAYRSPLQTEQRDKTVYLAVVGPPVDPNDRSSLKRAFMFQSEPPTGTRIASIQDGTANTIVMVEADNDQAVTWSKPDDWRYDPENPKRGLGRLRSGGFAALTADGKVHFINNSIDPAVLRALMTRAGAEPEGNFRQFDR